MNAGDEEPVPKRIDGVLTARGFRTASMKNKIVHKGRFLILLFEGDV
jgi:hypothetical protein